MEGMMKRGGGRPRSFSYDNAEFFKVFIPCRNSQQLKIPMSFVKEFSGTIHQKTTLKGYDGKLWNVDIENTDEGIFMKNGWINFVNHYSLSEGEFLVFKYIGNSTFLVKIFGTNGCKTEEMPTPRIVREMKIEEESEEEGVKKSREMPSSSRQPRGSNKAQKESSRLVIQEPVVTEDPYFIKHVIPRKMVDVHKVRLRPEMVLRNEKGEIWPVKVYKYTDGRILFGRGWMDFWQQNDVRPCDTCKFTFLKGGSGEEIKVEILRGQAK